MNVRLPHRLDINPAWWEIIRNSIRSMQIYRFQYLTFLAMLVLRLFLLRAIWTAIYDGRASLNGVSAETQVVFITIATLQGLVLEISMIYPMQARIESGQVATDLIRPFGFLSSMVASQLGKTLSVVPFLAVLAPIALLIGSLRMPATENIAPYVASLVLAYVVGILTWMLVGLLGFWMMNVSGVRMMLMVVSDFLGGALVPLWFMPDGLRAVLEFLPFQAITFLPASIYAGQATGAGLVRPVLVQAAWILVLAVANKAVWRLAQRRIVIQGG